MGLKKFKSDELIFTDQEYWQILLFFFGGNSGISVNSLTENDKSFAQALLIEAIDKSYAMSWIECLFSEAMKLNPSVKGIIKKLAKKAVRDWLNEVPIDKLEEQTIYSSIKNSLTRNWRSPWEIRCLTEQNAY